jgi:hypothetical protein
MRNESMKKFGTPTGAGPGSAKESVGLAVDGAPPAVWVAGLVTVVEVVLEFDLPFPLVLPFALALALAFAFGLTCVVGCEDADGLEGRLEVLVFEVELEEEEDFDDELEVVVLLVAGAAVQVCETLSTGREVSVCGSTVEPAGRFTGKLRVRPPTTVITTVHCSAEAEPIGTAPSAATAALVATAAIVNFLRIDTFLTPPANDIPHERIDPQQRDRRQDATGWFGALQRGTVVWSRRFVDGVKAMAPRRVRVPPVELSIGR